MSTCINLSYKNMLYIRGRYHPVYMTYDKWNKCQTFSLNCIFFHQRLANCVWRNLSLFCSFLPPSGDNDFIDLCQVSKSTWALLTLFIFSVSPSRNKSLPAIAFPFPSLSSRFHRRQPLLWPIKEVIFFFNSQPLLICFSSHLWFF